MGEIPKGNHLFDLTRNLSMVMEGKLRKDAKNNTPPSESAEWLIKRLEQVTQDLKALFK